ncbi:Protein of unknown function [Pyronema omphalodes CBS 100304]|uniref:Uncharacterized protein n=1 Tax=Pyronema omphalodes (strain CBS 100304) TaxID=1076935 RepID=U4LJD4_PYROM|nr:Protein of unknown function [Pyronema omphalodes CBS 100304]
MRTLWHRGELHVWYKCPLMLLLTATNLLCDLGCVEIYLASYNSGITTPLATFLAAWGTA